MSLHDDLATLRFAVGNNPKLDDALDRVEARVQELERERDEALRGNWKAEPGNANEKSEPYWLRNKLRSAVVHLRDVEDFYRVRGGGLGSHNDERANRARGIYEQISEDFINGRLGASTMRERAEDAEAALVRLVCSWCGDDFEQGDFASTSCCNCDPVPATSLPGLLKDARREAKEAIDAGFDTEAALAKANEKLARLANVDSMWDALLAKGRAEAALADMRRALETFRDCYDLWRNGGDEAHLDIAYDQATRALAAADSGTTHKEEQPT